MKADIDFCSEGPEGDVAGDPQAWAHSQVDFSLGRSRAALSRPIAVRVSTWHTEPSDALYGLAQSHVRLVAAKQICLSDTRVLSAATAGG